MKTDYNLIRQRDARLWRDYYNTRNEWYDSHRIFTEEELINHVITHCHPPYHITYDYALRITKILLEEHRNPARLTLKQQMWFEFAAKVHALLDRRKNGDLESAVADVLAQGKASRYFITRHSARRILARQKKINSVIKMRA